ncbi:MAG: tetratricopeptide repeat protein, partial [Myxococcales bacterium]
MKRCLVLLALAACAGRQKAAPAPIEPYAAARAQVEEARKSGQLGSFLHQPPPTDALGYYTLGLAEFADGDEARAAAALQKAAALAPAVADIQYRLGIVLYDGEKYADARAPLSRAVELSPKTARYRPPLAICLAHLGDRKAAMDALREVPKLSPTPEEAALAVKAARGLTDPFRDLPPASR